MERKTIKRLIVENQQMIANVSLVKRDIRFEAHSNYVLVGLRRSGKSYLLYQYVQELVAAGHSVEEFLYFNFEDDRLGEISIEQLDEILLAYEELFSHKPILLLDEIQIVDGWEKFARRLSDHKYRTLITGSNAKMLSSEISTTLGGRYMVLNVWPFSFAEHLRAKGIELSPHWQELPCASIRREFDTFFRMGGLPELTIIEDSFKRQWLSNLHNKIYFGDIVTRHSIRNTLALKTLIRKIAESVKQPLSFNRMASIASSVSGKVKQETVADYVEFAQESCMLFSIENISAKLQEKMSNKKYYFSDNGLLNLFLLDPETSLLENLVAITLRQWFQDDLFFYHDNVEVDFCLAERQVGIQVSYDISDSETRRREVEALIALSKRMQLRKLFIITMDDEQTIEAGGTIVQAMPAWKWCLIGNEACTA